MPYSKSQISNMALANCGVNSRIDNVDTEKSNEAIQCRLFFDHMVELILESCEWPFATRRVALQNLGNPPDEWAFRYKYPADCKLAIKIINPAARVETEADHIPYEIAEHEDGYGKVILTDQADATLKYNRLVTDPGLFSSSFAQAVALGLASSICIPLRVDASLVEYVQGQFSNWLAEAVNYKQREQYEGTQPESELQTARA